MTKHRGPHEDPVAADDMVPDAGNPITSPAGSESASGHRVAAESLEGQLGPDEISEPDEVIKNNEAKLHH